MKPLQLTLPDKEGVPQNPLLIPMEVPDALDLLDVASYMGQRKDRSVSAMLCVLGMCARSHLPARDDDDIPSYGKAVLARLLALGLPLADVPNDDPAIKEPKVKGALSIAGEVTEAAFETLPQPPTPAQLRTAGG